MSCRTRVQSCEMGPDTEVSHCLNRIHHLIWLSFLQYDPKWLRISKHYGGLWVHTLPNCSHSVFPDTTWGSENTPSWWRGYFLLDLWSSIRAKSDTTHWVVIRAAGGLGKVVSSWSREGECSLFIRLLWTAPCWNSSLRAIGELLIFFSYWNLIYIFHVCFINTLVQNRTTPS